MSTTSHTYTPPLFRVPQLSVLIFENTCYEPNTNMFLFDLFYSYIAVLHVSHFKYRCDGVV